MELRWDLREVSKLHANKNDKSASCPALIQCEGAVNQAQSEYTHMVQRRGLIRHDRQHLRRFAYTGCLNLLDNILATWGQQKDTVNTTLT